ncbi:lysM domain-containing GPI-anchored protein 2-like [Olea europaea var. sylvestris]|uniref:lysM domain-containing GPI-anchored protein 2-like n=1 Tax=Olea europaea var. sylvestris TaxID=158386 RepID=UPI000C1D8A66|nr:lysM domain-containing GPI-anchored protein 2-like [Olea europaea var. sylvestris]
MDGYCAVLSGQFDVGCGPVEVAQILVQAQGLPLVLHYGYVVPAGSSVEGIAQQYNTSRDTLLRLNNLTSPNDLKADAILDVPLRACSSEVRNTSQDYPLLVPNGTYVFTANNCVRCNCEAANNWILQCESSSLINSSCRPVQCEGQENFYLGNTSFSGCNRRTCAYAGYNLQNILTTLDLQSTCPASSSIGLQGSRWNFLLISIHVMLICLPFLKRVAIFLM